MARFQGFGYYAGKISFTQGNDLNTGVMYLD